MAAFTGIAWHVYFSDFSFGCLAHGLASCAMSFVYTTERSLNWKESSNDAALAVSHRIIAENDLITNNTIRTKWRCVWLVFVSVFGQMGAGVLYLYEYWLLQTSLPHHTNLRSSRDQKYIVYLYRSVRLYWCLLYSNANKINPLFKMKTNGSVFHGREYGLWVGVGCMDWWWNETHT